MTDEDLTKFRPLGAVNQESVPDEQTPTETIDLTSMFTQDVSTSGSFDLRGFRVSTVGKLLDAIPIPALLVDDSCAIVFANQACKKVTAHHDRLPGTSFSSLFLDSGAGAQADASIEKVFTHKIPLVFEGILGSEKTKLQGRLHLRPIRMGGQKSVMVIIEDVGTEREAT